MNTRSHYILTLIILDRIIIMLILSNNIKKLLTKQGFISYFATFNARSVKSQQKSEKYTYTSLIDQKYFENYYKPRLQSYEVNIQELLKQMSSPMCSINKVKQMIDYYLLRKRYEHNNPQGLILISTVLKKLPSDISVKYSDKIAELLIRQNDLSYYKCQFSSLMDLLNILLWKWKVTNEKIKMTLVKYKMVQLIKNNIENIKGIDICAIIKILLQTKSSMICSEQMRYLSLATLLENKITLFLQNQFTNSYLALNDKKYFMIRICQYYKFFIPKEDRSAKAYYQAIVNILSSSFKYFKKYEIFGFYNYFPYTVKHSQSVYYRDLLLEKISQLDFSYQKEDSKYYWNQVLLCYSIVSFQFYKYLHNISFRHQGDLNYLISSDIKAPELGEYFWKLYNQKSQLMNKNNQILHHIIRTVYPDKYIENQSQSKHQQTQKPPPTSENQITTRIFMALKNIEYPSKSESVVCGRYVDILISDNIVLECDGDYHFNIHKMEYNVDSHFRNMHLLLSGYRLILINIFQYNKYRYTDQLEVLIRKKIEFLKEKNAVIVI